MQVQFTTYTFYIIMQFIFIIFLKVLQQVKALREMNCVSIAAGEDHTVVVTDRWVHFCNTVCCVVCTNVPVVIVLFGGIHLMIELESK